MRFFDAHCDTILKIAEHGADPLGQDAQVSLSGLRAAGVCAQVFACFVLEARYPGRARERALELVNDVRSLCRDHPEYLALAVSPEALAACAGAGESSGAAGGAGGSGAASPTAAIIALEGADPLEGEPENLRPFHDLGVRLLTLAWDDNAFCGAASGQSGAGLSRAGAELVALCEELGVMVDVSHASDAGFWDVCKAATRPFVASHSDCRALCPVPRNLDDEMIGALAERGGVMGINLFSGFLSAEFAELERSITAEFWRAVRAGERSFDDAGAEASRALQALPRPSLDLVGAHVRHAVKVGGEDCVGLGGDLDGIDSMPAGIESVADYPLLVDVLAAAGLSDAQIEKVCWRNFLRVMAG